MGLTNMQEFGVGRLQALKLTAKQKLLSVVGGNPNDWVLREIVGGDRVNATDWTDLDFANPTTSGSEHWEISTTDQGTAGDLTNWLTTGTQISTKQHLAILGMFDNNPLSTPPITDVFKNTISGSLNRMKFLRSGICLDYWDVHPVYAYQNVVGISDKITLYKEDDYVQIKTCSHHVGNVQYVGLRGYTLEPYGTHIKPTDWNGMPVGGILGGIDPVQELLPEQIEMNDAQAIADLMRLALKEKIGKTPEDICIRRILTGDSGATDEVDIYQKDSQLAGQESWAQDDDEITAGDLSNIMDTAAAYKKVPSKKCLVFTGFTDRSAISALTAIQFEDGSGPKDFWGVEHCYSYGNDVVKGVTKRHVFYKQDDTIKISMNFRTKMDHFVAPLGFIAEPWDYISRPKGGV